MATIIPLDGWSPKTSAVALNPQTILEVELCHAHDSEHGQSALYLQQLRKIAQMTALQKGFTQCRQERKEQQNRGSSFAPLRLGVRFQAFFQWTHKLTAKRERVYVDSA